MTDYTPTTDEVREQFIHFHTRNHDEYQTGRSTSEERERFGQYFDRWLAGEIRKAKAEALNEAANHLSREGVLWHGDSGVTVREGWNDQPLTNWLRDRAQQLTEES